MKEASSSSRFFLLRPVLAIFRRQFNWMRLKVQRSSCNGLHNLSRCYCGLLYHFSSLCTYEISNQTDGQIRSSLYESRPKSLTQCLRVWMSVVMGLLNNIAPGSSVTYATMLLWIVPWLYNQFVSAEASGGVCFGGRDFVDPQPARLSASIRRPLFRFRGDIFLMTYCNWV